MLYTTTCRRRKKDKKIERYKERNKEGENVLNIPGYK